MGKPSLQDGAANDGADLGATASGAESGTGSGNGRTSRRGSAPKFEAAKSMAKPTPKRSPRKSDDEGNGDVPSQLDEQVSARMAAAVKDLNLECQKIKKQLQSSQSSGRTLLDQFANDETYSWGKNNAKADLALKEALEQISSSMSSFSSEYLMSPWSALQKRYGNEFLKAVQVQTE